MTTHDYSGDTNYQAPEAYPAPGGDTVNADPRSERLVGAPVDGESMSPDTAADPRWQQQADHFAANRDHPSGAQSTALETSAPAETGAPAATGAGLDDDTRGDTRSSDDTALFADADREGFRGQWNSVQAGFVDDPRRCVEQADGLVSDVVAQLSSGFADARSRLEQQWSRGEEASTEDLRVALKRYREFFDRLLAV